MVDPAMTESPADLGEPIEMVKVSRYARAVADCLGVRKLRMVAAESCTGGWISESLTAIPGSSVWFDRGYVTYSNESKMAMLGVPASTIADYGAVSEQTVRAMAAGALREAGADVAVAVSGIAGPGGGVEGKPVGTVWFAWAARDGRLISRSDHFGGDRRLVRLQAVEAALLGILELCGCAPT